MSQEMAKVNDLDRPNPLELRIIEDTRPHRQTKKDDKL